MGGCSASTSSDPLVENPHDAIRVWIHEDTMTVDEGGAHSAGSGRDGHVPRHDLAGRNRARKAGGGACLRTRPGLRPKGRAGQGRRRFQIWSDFSTDRSVVLRIAGSRYRQQNANDREMQRAHRRAPRRKEEVTDRQPRRPPFVPAARLQTAAGALKIRPKGLLRRQGLGCLTRGAPAFENSSSVPFNTAGGKRNRAGRQRWPMIALRENLLANRFRTKEDV